ncbi:protein brambleberry-like isoform x1 [Plakobranchus ocellatus]|uniref:Protein brambleberry-like isoform x1 n=1 Tax=Plakobranchus ocellatus TaxID=259542 RepID=A0AAV3ZNB5_9GAST|nr:protein brambleberry-like isoform x1 [Plakobranchus ocellatus]
MFEWLFGENSKDVPQSSDEKTIRFEVLSSDEKFLDFARTLNDLSPLDACYNIVIYNLKKKCGDLSEEELGKLSVQLLNCQSEAEDRPVFPCTYSMSLADCTKTMDGTTWNSYQIVGNRARAMCYATQQVQFRRLTEGTVNRLVSAASLQLKAMDDLKSGQEQLSQLTSETVQNLFESQKDLLSTQHALRDAHDSIFKHIDLNVKTIMQEKALIATGNRELAQLTENIREKLDSTSQQIQERETIEHTKHERILKDLKAIQDNTETSVLKLDSSLQKLLEKFEELDTQYSSMCVSLKKMNVTMTHVMSSITFLGKNLDEKINWLSGLLGGAENKLSTMSCCLLHIAYFFLLAVTATFLQVALYTRLVMMAVIVANVAAELNYEHSLDFAGLTVFLLTIYGGYKLTVYMGKRFVTRGRNNIGHSHQAPRPGLCTGAEPLNPAEIRTLLGLINRFVDTVSAFPPDLSQSPIGNGTVLHETSFRPATPPSGANNSRLRPEPMPAASVSGDVGSARRILLEHLGEGNSRASSRSSTPLRANSRSSTPSVSSRCLGTTVSGTQCRLPASAGSDYCRRHIPS